MRMNFNNILDSYDKYLSSQWLSKNSQQSYIQDVRTFLKFIKQYNLRSLKSISPSIIADFIGDCLPSTHNKRLSSLKNFFSFCEARSIINFNPTEQFKSLPVKRKHRTVTSVVTNLIRQQKASNFLELRNKLIISLLYTCGIRVSELSKIKLSDIVEEGIVCNSEDAYSRVVPISSLTFEEIQEYLVHLKKFSNSPIYLFPSMKNDMLSRKSIWRIVKDAGQKRGVNLSPTILRNSFCSNYLQYRSESEDLAYLQKILGLRDIQSTKVILKHV